MRIPYASNVASSPATAVVVSPATTGPVTNCRRTRCESSQSGASQARWFLHHRARRLTHAALPMKEVHSTSPRGGVNRRHSSQRRRWVASPRGVSAWWAWPTREATCSQAHFTTERPPCRGRRRHFAATIAARGAPG